MAKIQVAFLAMALTVPLAFAQRHPMGAINPDAPEGRLLQQIDREMDDAKKLQLLEQFAGQYPKDEGAAWVYEQLITAYAKAGESDKVLEAGQKLLAIDPNDTAAAHECLKAAQAKKDTALVLKWSATTSELARKAAQAPQPSDAGAVEAWKANVDYAKQVDIYTEYSLYATFLQVTDPKARIELGEALEARNPQSQYMPQVVQPLFLAYMQSGQNEKALAFAEKCLGANQASEEMMLAVAQGAMEKKEADKAIAISQRVIQAADARPKPEGVADAAWQTWKTGVQGRAEWISGVSYAAQSKWTLADKSLRAALPALQNEKPMLAQALFFLGLANYKLAAAGDTQRARDALHFSEQCAAIPGPFQANARTNVRAIRSQYHVQ